jgi:hypothetical protein
MNYPKKWFILLLIATKATASATVVEEKIAVGKVDTESKEWITHCLGKIKYKDKHFGLVRNRGEEIAIEEMVGTVNIYEKLLEDGSMTTGVEYTFGALTQSAEYNELGAHQRIITQEEAQAILGAHRENIVKNQDQVVEEEPKHLALSEMKGGLVRMVLSSFELKDANYTLLDDEFIYPVTVQIIEPNFPPQFEGVYEK